MQVPEPVPADSLCDLRPDSGRLHIVSKARIRPVREFPVLVRAGEHIVGVQRIRDALTPLTQDREQIGSKGYRLSPGQRLRVPYVAVNDSPLNAEGSFVPVDVCPLEGRELGRHCTRSTTTMRFFEYLVQFLLR